MDALDYDRLDQLAQQHHDKFRDADPFPHTMIDDFLPPQVAEELLREFNQKRDGWKHYHHYNERKLAITELDQMPPATRHVFEALQSQRGIDFIEKLSGIEELISDPSMEGAGMHLVPPGGHLNVHTDFLTHTKNRSWRRQINLLIYLNKNWQEEWNGNLELWDKQMTRCVRSVAPVFNRCLIFNTIPGSHHGHPHKLSCPDGECRKHILLYYYRDEGRVLDLASTAYRPLPSDSLFKKAMVAADSALVRFYTLMKGRTKISDRTVERILRRF